ncbi:MAG: SCO family protein [Betaproteobacteria bacterium]
MKAIPALLSLALALACAPALAHEGHAVPAMTPAVAKTGNAKVSLPEVTLLDQDGASRKLKGDVIGDRIVVMDFIYTTCTTVCPVISATFADVQRRLGDALGKDVALVSLTVDPARDTPATLKAFGGKHGARDGWVWLTGAPQDVNTALKGFGAYVSEPSQHPAMILVGDARTGQWTRFFDFPSASQIMAKVEELRAARAPASAPAPGSPKEAKARDYFTDTVLKTQEGRDVRFYTDVLKGHVVLLNFMYASCGDACPLITHTLTQVRRELGEQFGRDVRFVSLSVDPKRDTPADMARYAAKFGAVHPEWLFLTGDAARMETVLKKLGAYTADPLDHTTGIIIGNTRTERWRKVRPDAPATVIAAELRSLFAEPLAAAPQ